LGALSALISIYAVYVIDTAAAFAVYDDRLRSEALVTAALELTAYRRQMNPAQIRMTNGAFNVHLGEANVAIDYRSEAARVDLNVAPKELLAGLFIALGVRRDDANVYADRIIGWRTPAKGEHPEAAAYKAARLPYRPRGAKFPHANELSLVRGLPQELVERALPFVTVYSGIPRINILEAAPTVIAALPEMDSNRLSAVLAKRSALPEDARSLLPMLGKAATFVTDQSSNALRVNVGVTFDNGYHTNSEVVILAFDEGDEPYSVLTWRDDIDGPPRGRFGSEPK
jgi:general secretion pathway protein K